ncbi:hypothetical protein lerEdw1_013724 [Lerista edwardsae]|nr:hypothetical protein lerEdw1_013724 [Lerista edwardsae]
MPGFFPCFLSLLFLLLHSLLVASSPRKDDTWVDTTNGPIQGKRVQAGTGTVTAFLGIPYGEPPLGDQALQKPRPHEIWYDHAYDVTSFPSSCGQRNFSNPGIPDADVWKNNTRISDHCLFLNLWVPHPRPSTPAPVLVWIHGGGFVIGSASLDVYNGAVLAATENVIVASINYRLGILGFFYLPPAVPGNMGLLDQQMALTWLKENAAVFGGDPAQLTLLGHGAGAASVGFHLLSPASQPLFARAVLQSGAPNAPWAWKSPEEAKVASLKFSQSVSCAEEDPDDVLICLQDKYFDETDYYSLNYLFRTTTDGVFLSDDPQKLIEAGRIHQKPVIAGVTSDEGSAMVYYLFPEATADDAVLPEDKLMTALRAYFGDKPEDTVKSIVQKYSGDGDNPGRFRGALAHVSKDREFVCPMADFTAKMVAAGSPVYAFYFTHYTAGSTWHEWAGAVHGAEIPYVFGTLESVLAEGQSPTPAEAALSRTVMKYWADFARSGKPSQEWPLYDVTKPNFFRINTEKPQVMQTPPTQLCSFLATQLSNAKSASNPEEDVVSSGKEEDGDNEIRTL